MNLGRIKKKTIISEILFSPGFKKLRKLKLNAIIGSYNFWISLILLIIADKPEKYDTMFLSSMNILWQ
jgi:hypothetical protein